MFCANPAENPCRVGGGRSELICSDPCYHADCLQGISKVVCVEGADGCLSNSRCPPHPVGSAAHFVSGSLVQAVAIIPSCMSPAICHATCCRRISAAAAPARSVQFLEQKGHPPGAP